MRRAMRANWLRPDTLKVHVFESQSPDPCGGTLPIGGKPDEVKHVLANVDATTIADDMLDSVRGFMRR